MTAHSASSLGDDIRATLKSCKSAFEDIHHEHGELQKELAETYKTLVFLMASNMISDPTARARIQARLDAIEALVNKAQ